MIQDSRNSIWNSGNQEETAPAFLISKFDDPNGCALASVGWPGSGLRRTPAGVLLIQNTQSVVMKNAKFILCLVSLLVGLATAYAGGDAKKPQPDKSAPATTPKAEGARTGEHVVLTGSYIKRDVKRSGQITDGPSQVLVIDQKTIANSGASDLRQLLMRQGVGH